MALPTEAQRSFRLYVTHVDGYGHFLKICGQLDQQSSLMIESLFEAARENLEEGIGMVPPAAIHEGIICAAKYKDGTYYRAKIINTTNLATGLVGVHFIDYGNKDIISLSTIRFLDKYDPMFLQLRGQATDYYLSRVMHPAGRWEEPLLLKLQGLVCYSEYITAIEAETRTLPLIAIQFKGNDLSTHLVNNRFGVALPVAKQEVLLLQMTEDQQGSNWSPTLLNEPPSFTEHVPFLINQNFPNPATAMRLNHQMPVQYNGAPQQSLIGQRLLVNKASRNTVNLRAPMRQPQQMTTAQPVSRTTPSLVTTVKPSSPKKSNTYKSRLIEVNSQNKVFVSYAEEGPELFAVQVVSDAKKLQDMMDDINRRPHSSLTEPPMIGTVCLGRMSGDRIICRAIVMNLSGSQCKLFFVDFGDTEMVSYYDIFDIPEEFVKPNVFAMRFCLSGVKKLEKGPHLNEAFKQLINGKVLMLHVVPPEGPPLIQYGELYLENKNVLDLLLANMKDKLQFRWMEMLSPGTKHSVLVSYVDSCIKFYVQLSDHIGELNAVMDAVKIHCEKSSSPGPLPVGAVCCARFPDDENWYRAMVRNTKGDKVVVAYVDYGNEQDVNVSDLRTITPDLIQLPAQALKCALKGFDDKPVETKTSNQLEMLALEKTLMANIVGVLSSDTMLVSLVDDTVSPPLDIARRMNQLSQPRSTGPVENKATTPVRKDTPESISSPEGSVPDDGRKKSFRREKSFKDEKKPRDEDFGQRGSSFRGRESRDGFDRSGPGRHSDKFSRPDRGDRRKPWESQASNPASAEDSWVESPPAQVQSPPLRHNRDNHSDKYNNDEETKFDKNRPERRMDNRGERRDNWGDKKENWGDKKESWSDKKDSWAEKKDSWGDKKESWNQKREFRDHRAEKGERNERYDRGDRNERPQRGERSERFDRGGRGRSNFSPRDRAERSYGSTDNDKRSERNFRNDGRGNRGGRNPPFKSQEIQYKELSEPVPLDEVFTDPIVESGTQHEVSVTWIISPENFYTQILSLQPKFLEMMHKIPEMYKGVRSFTGNVAVGNSVLARYPADGVLYRATIVAVQPFSKFIVRYIDFGNKQLVDGRDIWQLDRKLMELPKMAVHCSLVGVAPVDGEWKSNQEIDLCFNAPRYQCIFQECVEDGYQVSLWSNGVSVSDILVEKQLATVLEHESSVTLKDEAIDLTIIIGQQIMCRVTHVDSYDKFYVQLDLEKAGLVESATSNFDSAKLTPLMADSVAEGIHCTVRHKDKIYRAILGDVSDTSNIQAVLPDFGNTVTTSLDNLMILPTELSVYYYQSLECSLNNYSTESNTLIALEDLRTQLTGNKYIIYINDVDGVKLVSTLYDPESGEKISIFEPDKDAYEEVIPLCSRSVFNYNFGMAFASHIENLNEMYLLKATDCNKIAAFLDLLYQFYEEGTPEALEVFEADGLCAVKSHDGNWYRATIISSAGEDVTVQFSDYGNTETVKKNAVRKLDPKFYEPCCFVLVAGLSLVALRDDAVNKLREWTNDKEVQVTLAFGSDGWLASLHLDGVDLSDKLTTENLAAPKPATEEILVPEESVQVLVEPISLPDGCTQVYISHIDTPGQFWLQMAEKVDAVEEIQAELQNNFKSYVDIDNREMGTLCVAKYSADDHWYRAEILDADSDITTVRFIDYGNTDVLDNQPGLIKVMPDHLKEIERYVIKASVNAVPSGTGQWSEPASDYFTQLVGDHANPVDAMIVLKDVTTYVDVYVNGQNLTDKLVSEGHATKSEEDDCGDLPSCFASHVNSPSEFWIQLETATVELQAMETAMVDAENFPLLDSKEEGVLCAAKYPEDDSWYRAQVIVDGSEGTEVLFMDYGNASIANELRSLPDDLKKKPALSRKCALQKPRDIKWSRKSEVKFNELAAEGATIFNIQFIASGDISIVELFLEGKSVTEELVNLCEEQPSERPTPVGQDLRATGKICYLNSLDEIYLHLDDFMPNLDKVTEMLTNGAEFENSAELKVGSICTAFWNEDKQWYRARILESCDVGYHVQFIDYGNKAKCEDFRQLPEEISQFEPIAKCCRLSGVEDINSEVTKAKLDDLVAELTSFQIEFLDSIAEPSLVKLLIEGNDVISLLNEKSLPIAQETREEIEKTSDIVNEIESSKVELDESIDSAQTVIENTLFNDETKENGVSLNVEVVDVNETKSIDNNETKPLDVNENKSGDINEIKTQEVDITKSLVVNESKSSDVYETKRLEQDSSSESLNNSNDTVTSSLEDSKQLSTDDDKPNKTVIMDKTPDNDIANKKKETIDTEDTEAK